MPTAEPILERISQNVIETLEGITEEAGYWNTLLPRRGTTSNRDFPNMTAVLFQEDSTENQPSQHYSGLSWRQPYYVEVYVFLDEEETTPIDTFYNRLWADISKALMVDTTRGGLAIDTKIRPSAYFSIDASTEGIIFNFDVLYRTRLNDPYSIG